MKSLITRFECRVCSKEMQVFCGVSIIIVSLKVISAYSISENISGP